MAFGTIEIVSLTRTQDYTAMKQNEDNKGMIHQTSLGQRMEKKTEQLTREVHSSDNSDWQNKKFDAREKGSNEYAGDGGKKRRGTEQKQDQVIVKGHQGFDMKI